MDNEGNWATQGSGGFEPAKVAVTVNTLTINVLVEHEREDGTVVASRHVKVEAWERQAGFDYPIAEGHTGIDGRVQFTNNLEGNPILNEDSGLGDWGTRDLYFKIFAQNEAARVSGNLLGA